MLVAQNIDLDIVYEDDDLVGSINLLEWFTLVGELLRNLINALIYHLKISKKFFKQTWTSTQIGQGYKWVTVIAKNDESMVDLSNQFAEKTSKREYIALVWVV